MRIALAVPELTAETAANLDIVCAAARTAGRRHPDLVLFPESCLTGFAISGDPVHDLGLGIEIPGEETRALAGTAVDIGAWLAVGVFERAGDSLCDTAVLLAPDGSIALRYRRISPGWHDRDADPGAYLSGSELAAAATPFGRVAFLICGDLFDETLVRRVRRLAPDCLLVPTARSFDDGSADARRWDREEKPAYIDQAGLTGAATFIVNCLCRAGNDRSFGGALAVGPAGRLIADLPVGRPGILVVEA